LLVLDRGLGELPATMRLVAGRTAQAYNRRKKRRGAFWEDRYHATAVQADDHLARCMTYIDLNMVRAGAVSHPAEWDVSGFAEIQNPWKRKGVIDFDELRRLLGERTREEIAIRLRKSAEAGLSNTRRDAAWTAAVGVGDETYLAQLRERLGSKGLYRRLEVDHGVCTLRESD
jgi:putative transposase